MKPLQRLTHRVTGKHTWRLALSDDGRHPVAVHLTCRPCRIDKPIPDPQNRIEPCFCLNSTCEGWQAYVAAFVECFGVKPTRDDVEVDRLGHEAMTSLVDLYGTHGSPQPMLTALARLEQEIEQ